MKHFSHCRHFLLLGFFTAFFSLVSAAKPKVEGSVVGPLGQSSHYVVSEQGAHVGFAGAKGGKFVVMVDGVAGPEVDQLLRPTGENVLDTKRTVIGIARQTTSGQYNEGPLLLSVDGEHHAYLAVQGSDIVVIHDGKVVGRSPRERYFFQSNPLTLTPKGGHVFWTEIDASSAEPLYRVVDTGKPGPWAAGAGSLSVVVNADDTRHAYPITAKGTKKHALVVDGKEAGYYGSNPTFTADGKYLITAGIDGKQAAVLVDGSSVATGVRIGRIVAAPVGRRWAATVFRKNATHHDITALIVDGKEVSDGENTQNIWFSPDGKHYAAASHHYFNRGPDFMIVDGKRGAKLKTVSDRNAPSWSPDSSTLVYSAVSDTEPVIVVVNDGKETTYSGTLIGDQIAFAKKGDHYAFTKRDPRNQVETIVDGKPAAGASAGSVAFSDEGSRHGFLTNSQGGTGTLVVNGEPVSGLSTGYFGMWTAGVRPPAFTFSPDGKHTIAFARDSNSRNLGLWLNGKLAHPVNGQVHFPTFTPDSKHLFWAAEEAGGLVVYVDGQPTAQVDRQAFNGISGVWSMDKSGTLTFVGAEGDSVKRYRITAASDTSVATLMASGTMSLAPAPKPTSPPAASPSPTASIRVTPTSPPAATAPAAVVRTAPTPSPIVKSAASPATSAAASPAALLTWNDLVRRPETRPTSCTIKKDYRFQGGAMARAGSVVNIVEVKPADLVLETTDSQIRFGAKPDETDILAVANASWSRLTPAQRDLTYAVLMQRSDLWPYRLKLTAPFNLEGRKANIGDSALLLSGQGNQLLVRLEGTDIAFDLEPQQTNIMAQARATVGAESGAKGRLLEELSGKLVSPINGQSIALDADARPKYVVMYMGAGWCGPCQAFSPELVKLLKQKSPKRSDVMLLYISGDRSPAEAKTYVTKLGIDWPTLYFKNRGQMPAFHTLFGETIPQLVVTDRHGKVVIDSSKIGTARALQQLAPLL